MRGKYTEKLTESKKINKEGPDKRAEGGWERTGTQHEVIQE